MKRNANTTAATKAAVAQHTTTERKSAERSTTMRNANTTAATKPMTIDAETGWKFTPASIALNGHVFEADKYAVAEKGDVYVLAKVEGVAVRIHVGKASPVYHEALEAAVAFKAQPKAVKPAEPKPATEPAKPVETKAAEPAKQAKPATKRKAPAKAAKQPKAEQPAEPAKPVETKPATEPAKPVETKAAEPAKQAKPAAEPAKPVAAADAWIGTTIEGKGWRVAFDEATQRTRVIFDADPSAKQRAAIDAAGFYWSNTTKSWNKKLTRKAYRAAKLLAETLNAIK